MVKSTLAAIVLLTATLIACGGVSDGPQEESEHLTVPTVAVEEIGPTPVQPEVTSTASQSEKNSLVSPATQSSQTSADDDRVESLVAEWEGDLASTKRVTECVEQALGLKRPLLPEDLQLQANQPAIVTCLKAEVGDD